MLSASSFVSSALPSTTHTFSKPAALTLAATTSTDAGSTLLDVPHDLPVTTHTSGASPSRS